MTQIGQFLTRFIDPQSLLPLANGKVEVYAGDTTTELLALVNGKGTPIDNPVILDSNGMYADGVETEAERCFIRSYNNAGSVNFPVYALSNEFWYNAKEISESWAPPVLEPFQFLGRVDGVGEPVPVVLQAGAGQSWDVTKNDETGVYRVVFNSLNIQLPSAVFTINIGEVLNMPASEVVAVLTKVDGAESTRNIDASSMSMQFTVRLGVQYTLTFRSSDGFFGADFSQVFLFEEGQTLNIPSIAFFADSFGDSAFAYYKNIVSGDDTSFPIDYEAGVYTDYSTGQSGLSRNSMICNGLSIAGVNTTTSCIYMVPNEDNTSLETMLSSFAGVPYEEGKWIKDRGVLFSRLKSSTFSYQRVAKYTPDGTRSILFNDMVTDSSNNTPPILITDTLRISGLLTTAGTSDMYVVEGKLDNSIVVKKVSVENTFSIKQTVQSIAAINTWGWENNSSAPEYGDYDTTRPEFFFKEFNGDKPLNNTFPIYTNIPSKYQYRMLDPSDSDYILALDASGESYVKLDRISLRNGAAETIKSFPIPYKLYSPYYPPTGSPYANFTKAKGIYTNYMVPLPNGCWVLVHRGGGYKFGPNLSDFVDFGAFSLSEYASHSANPGIDDHGNLYVNMNSKTRVFWNTSYTGTKMKPNPLLFGQGY